MKIDSLNGQERLDKIKHAQNITLEIAEEWADLLEYGIINFQKLSISDMYNSFKIINVRLKKKIITGENEYLRIIKRSIEMLLEVWVYSDYLTNVIDEVDEKFNPMLGNSNDTIYEVYYNKNYNILSNKIDVMILLFGSDLKIEYKESLQKELTDIYTQTINTLIDTIDVKDAYTRGHIERVSKIAESFGKNLGLSKENLDELLVASKLHDVGKIGISETILTKEGTLSTEEYNKIKQHTEFGEVIVKGIPGFEKISKIVKYHHERYDGNGYYNLSPELIPENVYIISLCDAFDAMNSNRSYRKSLDFDKIIDEYKKCSGKQFEPVLCGKFISFLENNSEYIQQVY